MISEDQLRTWMKQGSIDSSSRTYAAIRGAIQFGPNEQGVTLDVYLQGSYGNSTNIRGDSDVDVVAELKSSLEPDLDRLDSLHLTNFHTAHKPALYDWDRFRADVVAELVGSFGSRVVPGSKAFRVEAGSGLLAADVLVAITFREYFAFRSPFAPGEFEAGVAFKAIPEGRWVINYPRQHRDNCVLKHASTGTNFKPAVRMFKNARTYLVDRGGMAPGTAPSYFIESLLYNVPDDLFGGSAQDMFTGITQWLGGASWSSMVCANGIVPLFGPSPEQ